MDATDVQAAVAGLIRQLQPEIEGDISPPSNFDELGVDSMSMIDLIVAVEKKYDVVISDEDLSTITTVEDLIGLVLTAVR